MRLLHRRKLIRLGVRPVLVGLAAAIALTRSGRDFLSVAFYGRSLRESLVTLAPLGYKRWWKWVNAIKYRDWFDGLHQGFYSLVQLNMG